MASQVLFFCREAALFRGFNLVIRGTRLGNATSKWFISHLHASYRSRQFSSASNEQNPANASSKEKREDLERLKQLLHRKKATKEETTAVEQPKEHTHLKETQASSVDVNKLKELLSSLSTKREIPLGHEDKPGRRPGKKISATRREHRREGTGESSVRRVAKESKRDAGLSVDSSRVKDALSRLERAVSSSPTEKALGAGTRPKLSVEGVSVSKRRAAGPSVDPSKIKDVLSSLGQDASSSPTEDVLLAGRRPKLSADSVSAMEGALHIKQRQVRDRHSKKQMATNSIRVGPCLHWFDDVVLGVDKPKLSEEGQVSVDHGRAPTLFQEMAEQEVRAVGTSVALQSGFDDLIANVDRQWSFPIDNEACKTEEGDVGFEQHVFLEHMLAEFPTSGNIRQFMELVVSGLQQNPHLTVNEKKEHVLWFQDYFEKMPEELVHL